MSPAVLVLTAGTAMGGPEGESVVAGQASFDRVGATTTITAADNTIIEYNSFNIGAREAVRFVQPSADARVLNRVLGASPSQINGSLTANGQVYLVNEAGVFFGNRAVVDAGAIFAAAGSMSNTDFLSGVNRLTGLTGEVRNAGSLAAAEIHLAGRRVTNVGDLAASGVVTMTAGDQVLIGKRGGHVFVRADGLGGKGAVEQGGSVQAERVILGAGDLFSVALRPTSRITADEVRIESDGAGTVHVRGSIDATSETGVGGSVAVTGAGVAVLDAEIDVSGQLGGGEILLGGGYRGDTSVIDTAGSVYVASDAMLKADAIRAGNGGTVVTWADNAAVFEGTVSIRGGRLSGDGGRAEVSSPRFVAVNGSVDGSAENGRRGSLLIDPENISILDSDSPSGGDLLDDNQILVGEAAGLDVVVSTEQLETIGDVDVLLEAEVDILIGQIEDGSLDLPQTAGQTFTLTAGESVLVGEGVSINTQGGSVVFTGNESVIVGSVNTNGGDITLTSDALVRSYGSLETDGGTITYSVDGGVGTAEIVNADAGAYVFDLSAIELTGTLTSQAALDLTGVSTITFPDADTAATIGALDGLDTFAITLDPAAMINGPGGVRFVGSTITLPSLDGLSRLEVTATESLTLNGDIRMDNRGNGLGGLVDLREAETIMLGADIRIDTDRPTGDIAGDVLLNGATIDAAGSILTIDTNIESRGSRGRIAIGDAMLDQLVLFGGTAELFGAIETNSALSFASLEAVRVEGDAAIMTGGEDLSFGGLAIDGPGSLTLDLTGGTGAGDLTLDGEVGGTDPLGALAITGESFQLNAVTTTGDQTYTSSGFVRLNEDLSSTGSGSIEFDGSVIFDEDRTLTSAGAAGDDIIFRRTVVGEDASLTTNTALGETLFDRTVRVNTLTTLGSVNLRGATIQAEESIQFGEDAVRDTVMLSQAESSVQSRTGNILFRSGIQGSQTLRLGVDPTVTGNNIPVIVFEDSIGDETALDTLVLGDPDASFFGGTRTETPAVATVVFGQFDDDGNPVPDLAFEVMTDGDFVMNPLEKLTALGSLSVTAGGTAQIGDMTTPGDLSISAADILINTRAADDLVTINADVDPPALRPETSTTDQGVDFVVGGTAMFDGPVRLSDASLPQPTIAEPAGQVLIENVQTRAPQQAITLEDLAFNRRTGAGPELEITTVLDAVATGAVTVPLAEGLTSEAVERAAIAMEGAALATPNVPEASPSTTAAGVGIRRPTTEEYLSAASGAAMYIDMPSTLSGGAGLSVTSARLSPEDANAFTESWGRLASAVNEPADEPTLVLGRIRSTLSIAAEQYQAQSGESINDADAFELFTAIRDSQADTSRGLVLVSDLIESVDALGLSEGETNRIETAILDGIRPASLERDTVRNLVESAGVSR